MTPWEIAANPLSQNRESLSLSLYFSSGQFHHIISQISILMLVMAEVVSDVSIVDDSYISTYPSYYFLLLATRALLHAYE